MIMIIILKSILSLFVVWSAGGYFQKSLGL